MGPCGVCQEGNIDRSISIVLPAFNEERRLPSTLDRLTPWLVETGDPFEIIVVNDGSVDGTSQVTSKRAAMDDRITLIGSATNRGKGAALAAGFATARHEFVLFLDADLPVSVETIAVLLDRCAESDADMVVGSRRLRQDEVVRPQPLGRRLGGTAFRLAAIGLGYHLTSDPQCGVKLLRRSGMAATVNACVSDRFAFDIELISRSSAANCRVVEMPVPWRHVEGSSLRPVRDALSTLVDLVVLRRRLRISGVT